MKGLSKDVVDVLMASWRGDTQKQYGIHLRNWGRFCRTLKIDPYKPAVPQALRFLNQLYKKGYSYSYINTARCALSTFITPGGRTLGTNALVTRFMKGIFNLRTPQPRYSQIWDVATVFKHLRKLAPARKLTLKQITLKLATLLALITASRAQTLSYLKISHMTLSEFKCTFTIDQAIKQTRPGNVHTGRTIVLKGYPPDRRLCPIVLLREYIKRTKAIRKTCKTLFVTWLKPHGAAAPATISRWVKTTLHAAGIDTTTFSGHSTRTASTSAAAQARLPIKTILQTAGWSTEATFAKFYNKPILKEGEFQDAVMRNSKTRIRKKK